MTTTQELLESSFELNLNNYGPEDVERLNDWAIKAHNALEALQAEIDGLRERLVELEKQEPVVYQAKTKPGFLSTSVYTWEDCEKADFLVYEADGVHVRGLYLAAGASPVEPSQAQPLATAQGQGPFKLLRDCFSLLESFDYENDEDSPSKAFFGAHINTDWFFHVKNSIERQLNTESKNETAN